jgi:RHS repeat-associated protein
LNGHTVTVGFDPVLRRNGLTLQYSTTPLLQSSYGYDVASRLNNVIFGTDSVGYQYLANSPLLQHVYFTNGTVRRMTTTRTHDNLNRLTLIQTSVGATPVKSFSYKYNLVNQRTNLAFLDNSFWEYKYDSLGQVSSAKHHLSAGLQMLGQQYEYGYDDIGNRKFAASGGNEWGRLRYANYTANNLNQYTQRINPGEVDVTGAAALSATVTVNDFPTLRQGEYYWADVPTSNHLGARFLSLTNYGVINDGSQDLVSEVKGNLLIPAGQEAFTHDFDGNLTVDSLWNYTWDAENRLIKMTTAAGLPLSAERRLELEYDWRGRRIRKRVYDRVIAGTQLLDEKYVYDGWNLLTVLNGANNTVIRSFAWGDDLSGTLQGAGGVGGLLAVKDAVHGTYFTAYDGNGNVSALLKATDGVIGAEYEYSAFGETVRASGVLAKISPFRFSTKFTDDETGLLNYGFRYYLPTVARWANRDPLAEVASRNLYAFVENSPTAFVDFVGLLTITPADDGSYTVDVAPCEIVRVIDHGLKPKDRARFVFAHSKRGPGAAAFLGCWADTINSKLKKKGHMIPGAPIGGVWTGTITRQQNREEWIGALKATAAGAQQLAQEWTQSGQCATVTVYRMEGGKVTKQRAFTVKDVDQVSSWAMEE